MDTALLYVRVSTEEQVERETIQAQLDFLRNYCTLYAIRVEGEYLDAGVSGTVPLAERPGGGALYAAAGERHPTQVLVHRLDRLGRSLYAIVHAYELLESCGVAIRSVTEPFDTTTPFGKAMFQFLGIIAELEHSTITDRLIGGRDRVVRAGVWTTGPIPFGYDVDGDGYLIPSERVVEALEITEAELAREIFRRVAAGGSVIQTAAWLNNLGIPVPKRYRAGKESERHGYQWHPSRLGYMLRSPVYKGQHVFKSRQGPITRETPALISDGIWNEVRAMVQKNRAMSKRGHKFNYLLSGLIKCGNCGHAFGGYASQRRPSSTVYLRYRCTSQLGSIAPLVHDRCRSRSVRADQIEELVWEACRKRVENPGDVLAQVRERIQAKRDRSLDPIAQRRTVRQMVEAKKEERERLLVLYRRGTLGLAALEAQLSQVDGEELELHNMLSALQVEQARKEGEEAFYRQQEGILTTLRSTLEHIDQTSDWEAKRRIVTALVDRVVITTDMDDPSRSWVAEMTWRLADYHK